MPDSTGVFSTTSTYTGGDVFYDDTRLAAGQSYSGVGTITITNEGAVYITDVSVVECEAR